MKSPVCSSIYSFIWVSYRDLNWWHSKGPDSFSSFDLNLSLYNLDKIFRYMDIHLVQPLLFYLDSSIGIPDPCLAAQSFPTFLTHPQYCWKSLMVLRMLSLLHARSLFLYCSDEGFGYALGGQCSAGRNATINELNARRDSRRPGSYETWELFILVFLLLARGCAKGRKGRYVEEKRLCRDRWEGRIK